MTSAFTPPVAASEPPTIVGPSYKPKGWFVDLNGVKICECVLGEGSCLSLINVSADGNGPQDSQKALMIIYDVFGFSSQILQGADFLAGKSGPMTKPQDCLRSA